MIWYRTRTWIIIVQFLSGLSMLAIGCCIYLLFRSKTLNIYHWCSALGLSDIIDDYRQITMLWNVPDFIRFSIPDGLYCAAYILFIDAIWHKDKGIIKNIIVLLVPLVTISSELLQLFGIVRGTFDIYDLVCYSFPLLVYLSIICYQQYTFKMLKQTCV